MEKTPRAVRGSQATAGTTVTVGDGKTLRIPFDSLCLAAVVAELQPFVGGRVQGVRQPDEHTVAFELYAGGREGMLLLSCHPQFARAHLIARRPANSPQPPTFLATLRARVGAARLVAVSQVGFDRILELALETAQGPHRLVAEIMGKHANLMLVDPERRVVAAAKWVPRGKSVRPIISGARYERPPFPPRPSLLEAREGDDLHEYEGASPFLLRLLEAEGAGALGRLQAVVARAAYAPVLSPEHGAYPVSVAALGLTEHSRANLSVALETHFETAMREHEAETLRAGLLASLRRVSLAREVALSDLRQAEEAGAKAGRMQLMGELILAYGAGLSEGASELQAYDYEGSEVQIRLEPTLGFKENAARYFDRAKRAKGRMGLVRDQIERLSRDRHAVESLIEEVQAEPRLDRLRDLRERAKGQRWLTEQPSAAAQKNKEDRPYQGHRIRELLAPGGFTVLYGENAESNDYLTLRVAKPNDYWLHVRGSVSAHVVVLTGNKPERVGKETLTFAAKVAVHNSPSKHAGYVPVDYTLRKYVRKPRGAPKGTALYTHEKTLHIES